MITRLVAGAVVGGIVMFLLGFLIYGMALDAFMRANMVEYPGLMNETPKFAYLICANLVYGFLLAFIGDYWARVRTFAGGAKLGAIVGFLFTLFMNLMFLAFMNLHKGLTPAVVDVVAATVMGAITGGVIGVVLGKMDSKSES